MYVGGMPFTSPSNQLIGSPSFGPFGASNGAGQACGCGGPQFDQRNQMMMMFQMMEMMMGMMELMMGGGGFMGDMMGMPGLGNSMGMPGGGIGPGFSPSFGGPGGFSPGGGCSPGGGVGPMGPVAPGGQFGQGGGAAVDLARRFVGRDSQSIRGQMPHFTAAGGRTNNCADFVSSALESTGALRGHFVNVRGLERALQQQGYRQVPAHMAKPGDVWINHSRGHTELVTSHGGRSTIGSNNVRPGYQMITERQKNPNSGVYYSRG